MKLLEYSLGESWKRVLGDYFRTELWKKTSDFVKGEYAMTKVFPKEVDIFRALTLTPFDKVKVVILGQDPYHGEGQAEGLSFSVPDGLRLPPSLKNIYKEIESDCGVKKDFSSGSLVPWAQQGVLLLNAVLTVRSGMPASHAKKGWEDFTDTVIKTISEKKEGVIFLLWGNFARGKKVLIDTKKHLVLEAAHPSPFSAYNGFFGCKHFSHTNEYLVKRGEEPIIW